MGAMKEIFYDEVDRLIREGYSDEDISDALNVGEDQVASFREVMGYDD